MTWLLGDRYRVGEQWFPGANIRLGDLESVLLACGAGSALLELVEQDLPSHAGQGYTDILLACGQTTA